MKSIELTEGRSALVSDEDFDQLSAFSWHVSGGYAVTNVPSTGTHRYTLLGMHRVIARAQKGQQVDHINGNRLDNRRENLRLCVDQENARNRRVPEHSSVYKGVSWRKRERLWSSRIMVDGKSLWLGTFDQEATAAAIYDLAARKYFGAFAVCNFPAKAARGGDE